jgi:hypothetical protein
MDIRETVEGMKARGLTLRAEGTKLKVGPKGEVTEAEAAFLKEHQLDVIAYLTGAAPALGEDEFEYVPKKQQVSVDEYIARFERYFGAKGPYYRWPKICVEELRTFMNEHAGSKLLYEAAYAFSVIVELADGTQHEFRRTRWSDEQEKAGVPDRKKVTA